MIALFTLITPTKGIKLQLITKRDKISNANSGVIDSLGRFDAAATALCPS